jgi:REP element-mobilizing transposase RayT
MSGGAAVSTMCSVQTRVAPNDKFMPFHLTWTPTVDMVFCVVMRSRIRRVRKPKGQLSFPKRDKNGQLRGGKRPGSGRKPKGEKAGVPHRTRRELDAREPAHVVLRVAKRVKWLRTPHAYRAIRGALAVVLDRADEFRIVHFSLQGDHLHLLCEASDRDALAKGLQAFQISAARRLNREMRSAGAVFPDRYFVESLGSVRQVRHTLAYVLNNWRKHRQDGGYSLFDGRIDPYSSGVWFAGWKERTRTVEIPDRYEPPRVSDPRTWYLTTGYKLGPPISVYEVPGPRPRCAAPRELT